MPLQATSGAASYDAFGGGVPVVPNYIEEVFSTYLYTGTGTGVTQRIASGIDLATKGGMVWTKTRTVVQDHEIYDTARGERKYIRSNTTDAEFDSGANSVQYKTSGWDAYAYVNDLNVTFASWTFRKQPKFFDVVTYTGTGVIQNISHNLGSVPGCIIVKRITGASVNWAVYHRSQGATKFGILNDTAAFATNSTPWGNTEPTSTVFTVDESPSTNSNGPTYVAYLFAHNAGGFGLTGTDNVISCGSYTTDGSGVATVNLGYEPQWVLTKATSGTYGTTDWVIADNMRGMPAPPQTDGVGGLFPNLSSAEDNNFNRSVHPTSTGFVANQYNSTPYIYIAIRRGPMKVPTSGTSVFQPIAYTGNGTGQSITTGITGDLTYIKYRTDGGAATFWFDRLRNPKAYLESSSTVAEVTGTQHITAFNQLGFSVGNNGNVNDSGGTFISQTFKRAPGFFDEVCYTGTGSATTVAHNLAAVPELMIVKRRSGAANWPVYSATSGNTKYQYLNSTLQADTFNMWNNTTPTASVFSISGDTDVNGSGSTYVAYLFATCAGVSKVTSFTGTGTLQTIDCGFTAGSRFVLIKRTDSTGDWYVWDSSRGLSSSTDPYLLLNSTAAEVTSTNWVDTTSTGFQVTAASGNNVNINGASYIALAIA